MDSTTADTVQFRCRKKLQRPDRPPHPRQNTKDAEPTSLVEGAGDPMESVMPTQTNPSAPPSQDDDSSQLKQEDQDIESISLPAGSGDPMESVTPTQTNSSAPQSQDDDSSQLKQEGKDTESTSQALGDKNPFESSAPTQTTGGGSIWIGEDGTVALYAPEVFTSKMNGRRWVSFLGYEPIRTPMEANEHFHATATLVGEEIERWLDPIAFTQEVHISELLSMFNTGLGGTIYSFIGHCLPSHYHSLLSWKDLETETQNRVKEWAPEAEQYFTDRTSGGGRSQLLCAWVWRVLFDNLFSADCHDKWAGPDWAAYGKMHRGLQGRISNTDNAFNWTFHSWRHHSVRMLYALHGPHTKASRLDAIFRKEFGPLIETETRINRDRDPNFASPVNEYLGEMIECAIRIDFHALATKASVSFEMHDPETLKVSGFPYKNDGKVMECFENPADGTTVDFIIRPIIRIHGHPLFIKHGSNPFNQGEPWFDDYHKFSVVPMLVAVMEDDMDLSDES